MSRRIQSLDLQKYVGKIRGAVTPEQFWQMLETAQPVIADKADTVIAQFYGHPITPAIFASLKTVLTKTLIDDIIHPEDISDETSLSDLTAAITIGRY